MLVTLFIIQGIESSLINCKEGFASIRLKSSSITSRCRYEKKKMKQRMQSQKIIFQIIESTKALGDYSILFVDALPRLRKRAKRTIC